MIIPLTNDHYVNHKFYGPNKHVALTAYAEKIILIMELTGLSEEDSARAFLAALPEDHFLKHKPMEHILLKAYIDSERRAYNHAQKKLR